MSCKKNCEENVVMLPDEFHDFQEDESSITFAISDENDSFWSDTVKFLLESKGRFFEPKYNFDGCTDYHEFYLVRYYGESYTLQYFLDKPDDGSESVQLSFELKSASRWQVFTVEPGIYNPGSDTTRMTFASKEGWPVHYKPDKGLMLVKSGDYTFKRIR